MADGSAVPHPFSEFVALNEETTKDYIRSHPALVETVGGSEAEWTSREAGDGNINYIYILEGPKGGLVIKQALPYIRVDRVRIESRWLTEQYKNCPQYVPYLYLFDETMSLVVMEYLEPPCRTLRSGILAGQIYPKMAFQIAEFLARSLFFTSAFALKSDVFRANVKEFHNPELCKATEQVIFMDAYYDAPSNAYLRPELEDVAMELIEDVAAKVAIGKLRNSFLSNHQALIHADFHTGSVMVTDERMYAIDGEFAFYGPMAFDVGKFIGNLLLTYFALDGHLTGPHPRAKQQEWLLESAIQVWKGFRSGFLKLWDDHQGMGDAYPQALVHNPKEALVAIQNDFMERFYDETLGFAAACMIRRILTIASVEDYTSMDERGDRALCSKRALKLARGLLVEGPSRDRYPDIQSVIREAQAVRNNLNHVSQN